MKTLILLLLSALSVPLRCEGAWVPQFGYDPTRNATTKVDVLDELVLTNGLVAVWHLDETGTGTRYDSWGTNHLYIRATANVTDTPGIITNAVNVTVSTAQGDLTNNAAGMTFTDFTVSAWYYPKVQFATTIWCGTNGANRSLTNCAWGIYYGSAIRFINQTTAYNLANATFNLNEWTHFTIVYSNSPAKAWAYKNGVFVGSVSAGTLGTYSADSFSLFSYFDGGGYKDEVILWSRGLTPAEAALVYRMKQFKNWPQRWR